MSDNERIEKLLVLLLLSSLRGVLTAKKALQLNLAGFSNIEIADFLQTSPQVITQSLYEARKKKSQKKKQKTVVKKKK